MESLIVLGIIVLLVLTIGIYLWSTYNGLVRLNFHCEEAWSEISVQLKRRADLIPNLIESVKGYATHEKTVFEDVAHARAETLSARGPAESGVAEKHLHSALKSILAIAEAYPQLQASQNFVQLQGELVDVEDPVREQVAEATELDECYRMCGLDVLGKDEHAELWVVLFNGGRRACTFVGERRRHADVQNRQIGPALRNKFRHSMVPPRVATTSCPLSSNSRERPARRRPRAIRRFSLNPPIGFSGLSLGL